MRILRDFYSSLTPGDRAAVWVAIGLGLAVGFGDTILTNFLMRPAPQLAPAFTAPPFDLRFVSAAP